MVATWLDLLKYAKVIWMGGHVRTLQINAARPMQCEPPIAFRDRRALRCSSVSSSRLCRSPDGLYSSAVEAGCQLLTKAV
jgi:hypothetical protein